MSVDLIIGAVGSQAVFVIRSHPVANIVVNIVSDVQEILLGSDTCLLNQSLTTWYL